LTLRKKRILLHGGILMITISIILYCVGVAAFVLLGMMFLYKVFLVLYWQWKNKYDGSNTEYEYKQLKQHGRSISFIVPILVLIGLGIYLYNLPMGFEKITGNIESVENIYVPRYGKFFPENKIISDKNEIKVLLQILNQHMYKRNITESRFGNTVNMIRGTESLILCFDTNGVHNYISLDISNAGYVYNSNTGQAYKITGDNHGELYDRLFKVITNDK
jgi:hypothetical protein